MVNISPLPFWQFLDAALAWLERHLDMFDPFVDGAKPDALRNKAMAELAFMCEYYYRATGRHDEPRIRTFVAFLHEVWQRPEYRELVVRNPEGLQLYLLTYNSLLGCGVADARYREVVQRVVDQGYATAVEVVPFRHLDFQHLLDQGGYRHRLPGYARLYEHTLLAKSPPLMSLTDGDVYCITHTLFYLADFGLRPIDVIPPEDLPTVRWMIGALLGVYLRLRDWDVLAELLLCCLCLRWTPPVSFDAAWPALLGAQLSDGSVPAPKFSATRAAELKDVERRTYCFEENYHTTMVGALAAFLSESLRENLTESPP